MAMLGTTALESATKVDANLTNATQIRNIAVAGRAERQQSVEQTDKSIRYAWVEQAITASNKGRNLNEKITF